MKNYFTEEDRQMPNKHIKRCSTLLAIKEMEINTTMSYLYTSIRKSKIKNSDGINLDH